MIVIHDRGGVGLSALIYSGLECSREVGGRKD